VSGGRATNFKTDMSPTTEYVLVNKPITNAALENCLPYTTANLWAFPMVRGVRAFNFNARDPTGKVWGFTLCTRDGRYKKPVIRGDWLDYVREKGLTVNDSIILTMVADAENGVSYNIRVEPNTELAI
jgi:hypothetical protein